jgi:hypothetical protein
MAHTDPQVVIKRLSMHLTGVSSPTKKRLLFALTARRGGSWGYSGRRRHSEGRRSCGRLDLMYGGMKGCEPQRQLSEGLRTLGDGEAQTTMTTGQIPARVGQSAPERMSEEPTPWPINAEMTNQRGSGDVCIVRFGGEGGVDARCDIHFPSLPRYNSGPISRESANLWYFFVVLDIFSPRIIRSIVHVRALQNDASPSSNPIHPAVYPLPVYRLLPNPRTGLVAV